MFIYGDGFSDDNFNAFGNDPDTGNANTDNVAVFSAIGKWG